MQNHHFDATDPLHPYLYSTAANPDSMPPDNALRIGPIHRDGFWPCETDGQWQYLPDYRGKTAYRTDNGQPETVQTVGELPAHLTLTAPPQRTASMERQDMDVKQRSRRSR